MKNLAIFASGGGSNAEAIIQYFQNSQEVQVGLVISNKSTAGVLSRAEKHGIPSHIISRTTFYKSENILKVLNVHQIDWIILAGFLWLIPEYLIEAYPDHILNIHPALLPKYGGKGMYGIHVHRAVKENNEERSGMTIHLVNKEYDKGRHIFQATTELSTSDTPEEIASKVLKLEHKYYPRIIHYMVKSDR